MTTDFTEANRAFFDDLAAKYEIQPWQQKMSLQITNYIQQSLPFIHPSLSPPSQSSDVKRQHETLSLFDYACGTGMISRALGPYVSTIKAMDLSSKMVERYAELARESEIPSIKEAKAVQGNLLTEGEPPKELNGPELQGFEIAAVGLGVHHFDDPGKAIGRLAQRLRAGGVLLIVDLVADEKAWSGTMGGAEHTIHMHGFSEGGMRELMEGHGLKGFGWNEMPEKVDMKLTGTTKQHTVFLARAVKEGM